MTIYGTIKAAISVKQAAEHYGLKVNRNGMACCPFHNDRHPSLKLNEDYRPDYNSWHKFDRHRGYSKAQPGKDDGEDDVDTSEPLMSEVADDRIFRRDEIERERCESYEDICEKVRIILKKKPDWADMFIAVRMDELPIREYAAEIGADENNITQKLKRAEKRIRENWK